MQEKSNLLTLIIVSILTAIIVGGAVYFYMENNHSSNTNPAVLNNTVKKNKSIKEDTDPLYYTLDNSITVSKENTTFPYTFENLKANNTECGKNKSNEYLNDLFNKFKDAKTITYTFTNGNSNSSYIVTIIENKANYQTMEEFKADFDLCYAGGKYYPKLLNNKWLVFTSSCGSGAADASLNSCNKIQEIIENSLKIDPTMKKYNNLFSKHLSKAHYSQWYLISKNDNIENYKMDEELSTSINNIDKISLKINDDGSFVLYNEQHPLFSKDVNIKSGGLIGTWELTENGELTLSFNNGDKLVYKILSLDEKNLKLESK